MKNDCLLKIIEITKDFKNSIYPKNLLFENKHHLKPFYGNT